MKASTSRIRDALGERETDRRAEQDEAQRREVDAAIEIRDLPLDLALPVGERDGEDHVLFAGADGRGRDHVRERPDFVLTDEAR